MEHKPHPSLLQRVLEGDFLLRPGTLAILLMVVGAIGFGVSLFAFEGQILCFLSSTLVVFGGLWLNIMARKHQTGSTTLPQDGGWMTVSPDQGAPETGLTSQSPAPHSWNRIRNAPGGTEQQVSPLDAQFHRDRQASITTNVPHLAGQVIEVLRRQGAQVQLEARRGSRSILQVHSQSGEKYTALVLEGDEVVNVSEIRGLYGLMAGSGSCGAFMVTGGSYTSQALDWAHQRSLTLLEANQVPDIRID